MNTYKIAQVRTECVYQEVEATSLEEAIELSDDCDTPIEIVDDTLSYQLDLDTTINSIDKNQITEEDRLFISKYLGETNDSTTN